MHIISAGYLLYTKFLHHKFNTINTEDIKISSYASIYFLFSLFIFLLKILKIRQIHFIKVESHLKSSKHVAGIMFCSNNRRFSVCHFSEEY